MALTLDIGRFVSYGVSQQREPKVTVIKFDDGGYELRMGRGMNNDLQSWQVPINVIRIADANALESFLAAHGAREWFWWIPPRQTQPRKFVCRRWSREPVSGSRTHDRMTLSLDEIVALS